MSTSIRPERVRDAVIALTLGLIVAVVGVLGLNRVQSMTVGLDLRVQEFSFRSPVDQPLSRRIPLSDIVITSPDDVLVPIAWERIGPGDLRLSADGSGGTVGIVALDGILAATGATVTISRRNERQFQIVIANLAADLKLTVSGPIRMSAMGRDSTVNFDMPGAITVTCDGELRALITLPEDETAEFFPGVFADSLGFSEVVTTNAGVLGVIRREVSSIQSGTYTLESLSGEERKVAAGQLIDFESSSGVLRLVRLNADDIEVGFFGMVTGMKSSARGQGGDMMPSHLDWLKARQTVVTMVGVGLALLGLLHGFGLFDRLAQLWRRAK